MASLRRADWHLLLGYLPPHAISSALPRYLFRGERSRENLHTYLRTPMAYAAMLADMRRQLQIDLACEASVGDGDGPPRRPRGDAPWQCVRCWKRFIMGKICDWLHMKMDCGIYLISVD